jgi:hypothetical protein
VVSRANARLMQTPLTRGYGLGMQHWTYGEQGAFGHDGGTFASAARLWALEKGEGIVIMVTGGEGAWQLIHEIQSKVATDYGWPEQIRLRSITVRKVDAAKAANLVGQYHLAPYRVITLSAEGDRLTAQILPESRHEIFEDANARFFSKALLSPFTPSFDSRGRADELSLAYQGKPVVAPRIDDGAAAEITNDVTERFRLQRPTPGGEVAIRLLIEQISRQKYSKDFLADQLAQEIRLSSPLLMAGIEKSGPLVAVTYQATLPNGSETYELEFANRRATMALWLGLDGKIHAFSMD